MGASESPPCSSDALATWRTLLSPWLQVLQRRVDVDSPPLDMVSNPEKLCIQVCANNEEETTDCVWALLVEAMELLELLARVDRRLAWGLLVDLAPNCETWLKTHYHQIQVLPRFQLVVKCSALFTDRETTFKGLRNLVKDSAVHSATYDHVKHALLVKWSEKHNGQEFNRSSDGSVQVALKFELDEPPDAAVLSAFVYIKTLVHSHQHRVVAIESPGEQERQPSNMFMLNSLKFNSTESVPASTTMLWSINRISNMGILIDGVNLKEVDTTLLDCTVLNEFLKNQIASPRGTGMPTLGVALGSCDLASTEAICMAIAHSRSLGNVRVDAESSYETGGGPDDAVRWLWIAYALFSREADHTIHTVLLNVNTLSDASVVHGMRALLSHADPLAFLHQSQRTQGRAVDVNSTAATAVLSPSAIIHRGYKADADQMFAGTSLVAGEPGVAYRIIRNRIEEDAVEIVVPHVGACWVYRCALLEIKPVAQCSTHSIRHLTLKFVGGDHVTPTAALIELIGGPLERLTIEHLDVQQARSTHLLNTVFAHCPNLKRLDLVRGILHSLTPLCSSTTNLEVISLVDLRVKEHSSWGELLLSLAVPAHPLAQSLRELHVRFYNPHGRQRMGLINVEVQSWCGKMLDTNKRLRRFVLMNCERDAQSNKTSSIAAHDGELLPVRQGPLPEAETLAFLSVVTAHGLVYFRSTKIAKNTSTSDGARYKLHSDVVQLILDFAAIPVRRECMMVYRTVIPTI